MLRQGSVCLCLTDLGKLATLMALALALSAKTGSTAHARKPIPVKTYGPPRCE